MESPGNRERRLKREVLCRMERQFSSSPSSRVIKQFSGEQGSAPRAAWASPSQWSQGQSEEKLRKEVQARLEREMAHTGASYAKKLTFDAESVRSPQAAVNDENIPPPPPPTPGDASTNEDWAREPVEAEPEEVVVEEEADYQEGDIEVPTSLDLDEEGGKPGAEEPEREDPASSGEESPLPVHLGARAVVLRDKKKPLLGQVRFIGDAHFGTGIWVGLELDMPWGSNDGTVDGIQYFRCKPKHGLFARASDAEVVSESATASQYAEDQDAAEESDQSARGEAETSQEAGEDENEPVSEEASNAEGDEALEESTSSMTSPAPSSAPEATSPSAEAEEEEDRGAAADEDDDDEEEEEEEDDINWMNGDNLKRSIERQMKMQIDPDEIFQFTLTECNLEDIFSRKSISYSKRYSTGNWAQDGLSIQEELVYKRDIGLIQEDGEDDF